MRSQAVYMAQEWKMETFEHFNSILHTLANIHYFKQFIIHINLNYSPTLTLGIH